MAVEVAKGIHDHPKYKLGSIVGKGKEDARTVKLSDFLASDAVVAPTSFDFDKGRKPFPVRMWGNDAYGDCEIAGRCNYLLRTQRVQTKTTPAINDTDAITEYDLMTGCKSPGDNNDTGMTTLDNLGKWRSGWSVTKDWQLGGEGTRDYHISAYGLIDETNEALLRKAIYAFNGVLYGVNLPITAQAQTDNGGPWDVVDPSLRGDSEPGSWGGHCIYSKKYDPQSTWILTWGMEIEMTAAFKAAYVMETYSVIDSFDTWFNFPHVLNVQGLIDKMQSLGINVQQ